ncbi:MAG: hypothetical protein KatS3mg072_1437 [Meiothermus sp.]|nr:MAG: hypothetical protein KatS3mg072_1437 [Meiothermus sp.]
MRLATPPNCSPDYGGEFSYAFFIFWSLVAGRWSLVAGLVLLLVACATTDNANLDYWPEYESEGVLFYAEGVESNVGSESGDLVNSLQIKASATKCSMRLDYPHKTTWKITLYNQQDIVKAKASGNCETSPPWPGLRYHLYMVLERGEPTIGFEPRWVEIARGGPITRIAQTLVTAQTGIWSASSTFVVAPCTHNARYRVWAYIVREAPGLAASTPIVFGPVATPVEIKCFEDPKPKPDPPTR